MCLSNLPGLNRASSNISNLFVAAIIIIPSFSLKPDISVSRAFKVWSLSSEPPAFSLDLFLPIASISSINITALPLLLAFLNNCLIRLAPTPTYTWTKSEPDIA